MSDPDRDGNAGPDMVTEYICTDEDKEFHKKIMAPGKPKSSPCAGEDRESSVPPEAVHGRSALYLVADIACKDSIAGRGDKTRHNLDIAYTAKMVINGSMGCR